MKILSIVWYKVLPPKFGGQKGIAHFNQALAAYSALTCVCSSNNEPVSKLPYKIINALPTGKRQFINPSTWSLISTAVRKEKSTHIILEHPYHGFAAYRAARANHCKLVVHSHNIESQRYRQLGKWWWRILESYEKWIHRKADLSLFKTTNDLDYAQNKFGLQAEKCLLMGYGVDEPSIQPDAMETIRSRHGLQQDEKILLFAGTLDYLPNARAVEAIYQHIAPALLDKGFRGKIIICGRNKFREFQYLKQLAHPLVINAGEVDDIETYFSAADVFINPVSIPSGVQTKTIDALSYSLPVVCFDTMFDGIDQSLTATHIYPVKEIDWSAFAAAIINAAGAARTQVPRSFWDKYSFRAAVEKLATRLNSI